MPSVVKPRCDTRAPVPTSPERSERRLRLLEESLRLVSESGLGAVTHRSVEQAAGAPHGSVTYWFGSREGLISALVDWLCDESERQARAIATPVQQQIAAGEPLDVDAIAAALSAWIDGAAAHHLARMELELQGAREPAHAERMTKAAHVFWDMCGAIARGLGSENAARDGRALAVMLDGVLLDRLAHPPQDQDVVATSVRWLLAGPAASSE
jgi:AcrR family transcriptional regulator